MGINVLLEAHHLVLKLYKWRGSQDESWPLWDVLRCRQKEFDGAFEGLKDSTGVRAASSV